MMSMTHTSPSISSSARGKARRTPHFFRGDIQRSCMNRPGNTCLTLHCKLKGMVVITPCILSRFEKYSTTAAVCLANRYPMGAGVLGEDMKHPVSRRVTYAETANSDSL